MEYKANNHLLVSGDGKLSLPRRSECIRYLSSASLRKDSYIQIASEVIVCPITFTNGSYLLKLSRLSSTQTVLFTISYPLHLILLPYLMLSPLLLFNISDGLKYEMMRNSQILQAPSGPLNYPSPIKEESFAHLPET